MPVITTDQFDSWNREAIKPTNNWDTIQVDLQWEDLTSAQDLVSVLVYEGINLSTYLVYDQRINKLYYHFSCLTTKPISPEVILTTFDMLDKAKHPKFHTPVTRQMCSIGSPTVKYITDRLDIKNKLFALTEFSLQSRTIISSSDLVDISLPGYPEDWNHFHRCLILAVIYKQLPQTLIFKDFRAEFVYSNSLLTYFVAVSNSEVYCYYSYRKIDIDIKKVETAIKSLWKSGIASPDSDYINGTPEPFTAIIGNEVIRKIRNTSLLLSTPKQIGKYVLEFSNNTLTIRKGTTQENLPPFDPVWTFKGELVSDDESYELEELYGGGITMIKFRGHNRLVGGKVLHREKLQDWLQRKIESELKSKLSADSSRMFTTNYDYKGDGYLIPDLEKQKEIAIRQLENLDYFYGYLTLPDIDGLMVNRTRLSYKI